jgi:hypothetical protein
MGSVKEREGLEHTQGVLALLHSADAQNDRGVRRDPILPVGVPCVARVHNLKARGVHAVWDEVALTLKFLGELSLRCSANRQEKICLFDRPTLAAVQVRAFKAFHMMNRADHRGLKQRLR